MTWTAIEFLSECDPYEPQWVASECEKDHLCEVEWIWERIVRIFIAFLKYFYSENIKIFLVQV